MITISPTNPVDGTPVHITPSSPAPSPIGMTPSDGRELMMRSTATHVQWKYTDETDLAWRNLYLLADGGGGVGSVPMGYEHTQTNPASVWTVNHGLGYKPGGIFVEDSGGNTWVGEVEHISENILTITFAAPFSGKAYIS